MKIPKHKIEEVLDKNDILDVVGERVSLQRKGNNFWGLCPFHPEKTPSFSVNPTKGIFYCFSCHKGGDAIRFLMEIDKLSFVESVTHLADKSGVALEKVEDEDPAARQRQAFFELNSRVMGTFEHFLWERPEGQIARDYLSSRGISQDLAKKFHLGYSHPNSRWLHGFLLAKNYTQDFLQTSGLFSKNRKDYHLFSGRLIFPIIDHRSRVLGFGGRALQGEDRKYMNSPESPFYQKRQTLYGLDTSLSAIRKAKKAIICEGYTDVIALDAAEVPLAVAPLGTAFTADQAKWLSKYVEEFHFLFDSDAAGMRAMEKSIRIAESVGIESKVISLSANKDPGDYLGENDLEALKKVLKYPINSFDYLIQHLKDNQISGGNPKETKDNIGRLLEIINSTQSAIRKELLTEKVSGAFGISTESIKADFGKETYTEPPRKVPNDVPDTIHWNDELFYIMFLIDNQEYIELTRFHLAPEDFSDPLARKAYVLLDQHHHKDGAFDFEAYFADFENEDVREKVLKKMSMGEYSMNPTQVVKDSIKKIKRRKLEDKKKLVLQDMKDAELMNQGKEVTEALIRELDFLQKQIEKFEVNI